MYNEWLAENRTPDELAQLRKLAGVAPNEPIPRLRREQFAEAPKERFHAEAAFYAAIERDFFVGMKSYLTDTLGVKSLIVGCADHTYWIPNQPMLQAMTHMDIVDGHVYWQHPAIWGARNTPMVNDPLNSTIVKLSRSAFAGKPYTVSEVNHPNPNEYASEMIPILAAYGAFQDWDGIFFYTFEPKALGDHQPYVADNFDITLDPVKMIQMSVGALLFSRPDVKPAREAVTRSYSAEQVIESMRLPESARPYFTPGFPVGTRAAPRRPHRVARRQADPIVPARRTRPLPLRHRRTRLVRFEGTRRTRHHRHRPHPGPRRLRQSQQPRNAPSRRRSRKRVLRDHPLLARLQTDRPLAKRSCSPPARASRTPAPNGTPATRSGKPGAKAQR